MGTLYVVATPIGNLSDFSIRAIDTLKNSDLILAEDTRQTIKLLNHFDINTKMISYHKFNEMQRVNSIINDLKNGKNIALVSDAGTPCISDPGYILVKEARENKIDVIGVPGASAVITALSIGGLDTSSFAFYGFVPTDKKGKDELFDSIKNSNIKTKVVYESPKRVLKLLEDLIREIPGCVVSVCSELTKVHEKCYYGNVEDVYGKMKADSSVEKGEYVVLISNEMQDTEKIDNSIESKIVDIMVKENKSIKEAVDTLNAHNKNLRKKDIYNAGLNLKNIIK